jgi:hypothetical protein
MDITTVVNLLVIGIFGLVFSIFVMLIRGTARVRREGPPDDPGSSTNTRPPSEELKEQRAKIEFVEKRLNTLVSILGEKQNLLTEDDKTRLTK